MEDEKQIEEMAKAQCVLTINCEKCAYKPDCIHIGNAKLIYNAGYRNCKDKVVLTEREHEIAMRNQ